MDNAPGHNQLSMVTLFYVINAIGLTIPSWLFTEVIEAIDSCDFPLTCCWFTAETPLTEWNDRFYVLLTIVRSISLSIESFGISLRKEICFTYNCIISRLSGVMENKIKTLFIVFAYCSYYLWRSPKSNWDKIIDMSIDVPSITLQSALSVT